jgi:hypothetical protein
VGNQLVLLGSCSEVSDSQRGCEALNKEFEGSTALEAVTIQRVANTSCSEFQNV